MINNLTSVADFLLNTLSDVGSLITSHWILSLSVALFILNALVRFLKNLIGSK